MICILQLCDEYMIDMTGKLPNTADIDWHDHLHEAFHKQMTLLNITKANQHKQDPNNCKYQDQIISAKHGPGITEFDYIP